MSNATIQVTDQHGGYVNFTKCRVTGYINIEGLHGRAGQTWSHTVDPKDSKVMVF